jgi:hypothetical protein
MPVIPATQKGEEGEWRIQVSLGKVSEPLSQKQKDWGIG